MYLATNRRRTKKKRLCTIPKKNTQKNRRSIASAMIYNCQYSLSVEAVYNGKSVNAFCFTIVFYYLSIILEYVLSLLKKENRFALMQVKI